MTPSLKQRTGSFTLILSAATLSLLLVGAGCASEVATKTPAANVAANVAVNTVAKEPEIKLGGGDMQEDTAKPDGAKPIAAMSDYKDGTYTATGKYKSPAGPETVGVTLTVKDGVVTDVEMKMMATNDKSVYMQKAFIGGIKAEVVGKKLSDLNVGKVSGSSLTGIGFNDAVAQIKAQAKA